MDQNTRFYVEFISGYKYFNFKLNINSAVGLFLVQFDGGIL